MNRRDLLFKVVYKERLHSRFVRLHLQAKQEVQPIKAGQFVQVRVQSSLKSWLRIPISIHDVDPSKHQISLLIQEVGEGSSWIASQKEGDELQILFPLGNGFQMPQENQKQILLVGGGCGVAPLFYLLRSLEAQQDWLQSARITFLIGAKTKKDLLLVTEISTLGAQVEICTQDGSAGTKGLVTDSPIWNGTPFDLIYTCGPSPMMKAISVLARAKAVPCQVSLENQMACGIGACLCCVTTDKQNHHRCVCTEGPVFEASELGW